MPNIEQGPINFSMIEPQTCKRIVYKDRNAQLWRRLGFCLLSSTSIGLFSSLPPSPHPLLATLSLYPNSCPPSFSSCYWCHRKISLTDSLQQMVLQCPSGILTARFNLLFFCSCSIMCTTRHSCRCYLTKKLYKQTSMQRSFFHEWILVLDTKPSCCQMVLYGHCLRMC